MLENTANCGSQSGKAKSKLVAQMARLIRRAGLTYADWRYVAKRVRQIYDLRPATKGRKLPKIRTADGFRRFYKIVDQADDIQHALMLRLMFYTAVRVSELCNIQISDIDLENCWRRSKVAAAGKSRGGRIWRRTSERSWKRRRWRL